MGFANFTYAPTGGAGKQLAISAMEFPPASSASSSCRSAAGNWASLGSDTGAVIWKRVGTRGNWWLRAPALSRFRIRGQRFEAGPLVHVVTRDPQHVTAHGLAVGPHARQFENLTQLSREVAARLCAQRTNRNHPRAKPHRN